MTAKNQFPTNPNRVDPYKNFRFRVKWDGKYVAAFSRVSMLDHAMQAVKFRSGGVPGVQSTEPGQTSYDPITLERGISEDNAFEQWSNEIWGYQGGSRDDVADSKKSQQDLRKDIVIEVYNVAGQMVLAYNVYRCWPSEYVSIPDLDQNGNVTAIQTLTLQNEGWERDTSVGEADA